MERFLMYSVAVIAGAVFWHEGLKWLCYVVAGVVLLAEALTFVGRLRVAARTNQLIRDTYKYGIRLEDLEDIKFTAEEIAPMLENIPGGEPHESELTDYDPEKQYYSWDIKNAHGKK